MDRVQRFPIEEESQMGEARRHAATIAQDIGFDSIVIGKISIVVNELSTNLLKHAKRGEILLIGKEKSLSILALDKGKGMKNVTQSMEDGYSTQGTAGNGLGAIKRMANSLEIYSQEGKGTAVLVRFETEKNHSRVQCDGFSLAIHGEELSGDSWTCNHLSNGTSQILVADGLGHGLLAHEASQAAVKEFTLSDHHSPLKDVENIHGVLRATRGAAVAVASFDPDKEIVSYCGLGNIAGSIVSTTTTRRLVSYNGTAGVQFRKTQVMTYPLPKGCALIMASDGLSTHWTFQDYQGLLLKHPLLIAGVLYRDYSRGNDDVTVIVAKESEDE